MECLFIPPPGGWGPFGQNIYPFEGQSGSQSSAIQTERLIATVQAENEDESPSAFVSIRQLLLLAHADNLKQCPVCNTTVTINTKSHSSVVLYKWVRMNVNLNKKIVISYLLHFTFMHFSSLRSVLIIM